MPLASAIAAVAGLALTFWRRLLGLVRRTFGRLTHGHAQRGAPEQDAALTSRPDDDA